MPPDKSSTERTEQSPPHSPTATSRRGSAFALLAAICAVAAWYSGVPGHALERAVDSSAYALCSADGQNIYSVNPTNDRAQCAVVKGAFIHDVGSLDSVQRRWNKKFTTRLPVRHLPSGSIVTPGLSDSHGHLLEYGAARELSLEGTKSVEEAVMRVRNHILSDPDLFLDKHKTIHGGGWDHMSWPSSAWPSAADLDSDPVIKGRRVILQSKDCHALWLSSKAIEVHLPLPDTVEGGVIIRNESGSPSGVLLDNAQGLIKQEIPSEADLLRRFKVAVRDAHSFGLTAIHDAGLDPTSLAFFKKQASKGKLPIRIYAMSYFDESAPYWGSSIEPMGDAENTRLSARSVKIFADGALRTGGAALHTHYADNPSTDGFMRLDKEVLFDFIPKFLRDGWQVNVHAIGDRANAIVLDAFEKALEGANVTALRPRLEHAQMMLPKDLTRLGKLGVIASVQPAHAISDMWYAEERLGPERIKNLYAFRSIIDSGARIALGSDFPVETMNPLSGFYAAVTRKSPDGRSPHGTDGWFPEQRLTRTEALRGMTIDAAYASFTENILGSLEPGKRADFTVLSQDIMTIPEDQILSTKVVATVIDGEVMHGSI